MTLPFLRTRPKYTARAVDFGGTSEYLTRGAELTGMADGKTGLLSVWLRIDGGDGTQRRIMNSGGISAKFNPCLLAGHQFAIVGQNAAGTQILRIDSVSTYAAGPIWRHLLSSWDLAAGLGFLYVNDVNETPGSPTLTNDTIDYVGGGNWSVGGRSDGTLVWHGCMAECFFHPTYLDISVEANRRKFISATGKPVSLGADGSTPLGVQPIVYLANELTTWQTNLGTGGGFTENGTLGAASTSPSD